MRLDAISQTAGRLPQLHLTVLMIMLIGFPAMYPATPAGCSRISKAEADQAFGAGGTGQQCGQSKLDNKQPCVGYYAGDCPFFFGCTNDYSCETDCTTTNTDLKPVAMPTTLQFYSRYTMTPCAMVGIRKCKSGTITCWCDSTDVVLTDCDNYLRFNFYDAGCAGTGS